MAGRPASYFRRQSIPRWAARWELPERGETIDQPYLDAVLRAGQSASGCFGLRLMWESLGDVLSFLRGPEGAVASDAALMQAAFGKICYIHLTRDDVVSQAVSLLKAEQTGIWHLDANGGLREGRTDPPEPHYDEARLAAIADDLTAQSAGWRHWFSTNSIKPIHVTYEEITAAPQKAFARILLGLGQAPDLAYDVAPQTAPLADDQSRAWAARFRASANQNRK